MKGLAPSRLLSQRQLCGFGTQLRTSSLCQQGAREGGGGTGRAGVPSPPWEVASNSPSSGGYSLSVSFSVQQWEPGFVVLCSAVRALYPAPPYPVPAPPGTAVRRPGRGVRASHVLKSWASLRVRVFLRTSAVRSWCKVFSFTDYKMTSCGPRSCLSSEARVHGTVFPFCS